MVSLYLCTTLDYRLFYDEPEECTSGDAPAFSTEVLGVFAVCLMSVHDLNSSPIETLVDTSE